MRDEIQIQFLGFLRNMYVESHKFYVNESKRRFLGTFKNFESEMEAFETSWFDKNKIEFEGESEQVFKYAAELAKEDHRENIKNLKQQTIFSIIAGMYHKWEIQLRDWLIENVALGEEREIFKKLLWKENISFVFDFISAYGWDVRNQDFYKDLNICRMLVNVYKHGNGSSFDELLRHDFTFIDEEDNIPLGVNDQNYWHYTDVKISEEHIDKFSSAITSFWNKFPERFMASEKKPFKKNIINKIDNEKNLLK